MSLPPAAVTSEYHLDQLAHIAASMPPQTDREKTTQWRANLRLIADQITAEAWHAGVAHGLGTVASGARYIVVTNEQYAQIRARQATGARP